MRSNSQKAGAVLVFAVLLLAAGVFVLAAIAQLAATQALVGEDEWQMTKRRVTLENSRAMARQFMLGRMFNGVVSTNIGHIDPPLGGFLLLGNTNAVVGGGDYWTTPSLGENDRLQINPYTPMERGGFYRANVQARLYTEITPTNTNEVRWNFQVRTRSPVAAGYSIVQHLPGGASPTTNEVPERAPDVPYIDMRTTQRFHGFPLMPVMPVTSVTNTNAGDNNGYVGYLSIPLIPGGSSYEVLTNYSLRPRDEPVTQLEAVVDLLQENSSDTNSVVLFDVAGRADYTNPSTGVTTNVPVTLVVLQGTGSDDDGGDLKPMHVVIGPNNTNTSSVLLANGSNDRLVYLNHERATYAPGDAPFSVAATNSGVWRLGLSLARSGVEFEVGELVIRGGIRTDRGWNFQDGSAYFLPEQSPEGLDYIADRMMWLEDYRIP